jgi:hypothetical protein
MLAVITLKSSQLAAAWSHSRMLFRGTAASRQFLTRLLFALAVGAA